jgi:hypothetical protein
VKSIQHLGDLTSDPKNARKHNPRNVGMIERALNEVGAARSIVVDENGVVLAGNATIEAAAAAGIERVQVVDADGETIIAVRRSGLTDEQKRKLALFDNRTAELAEWDVASILADLDSGLDLSALWNSAEIDELAKALGREMAKGDDPGPQIDKADELREKWQTERGQLWEIPSQSVKGKSHRLLCGDSTSAEDTARLMDGHKAALLATDPPYNVSIEYGDEVDDAKTEADYETFTRAWFGLWQDASERQIISPGCNNLARWCRYFEPYHVAPWIKTNAMTNGKVSRWWCWEPVLFFGSQWQRSRPNDVFDFPVPPQKAAGMGSLSPFHPCPKPLPMWVDVIDSYSDVGDIIAEAFSGSGTTHVAAEQLGRLCYGMELEAKYCAVILERLTGLGLSPRRVSV